MDIAGLVMAVASLHKVYATGSETFTTPVAGAHLTAVTFSDARSAETFTVACMGQGIPARYYGLVDGGYTAVVLH